MKKAKSSVFSIAKRLFIFQDLTSWLVNLVPPVVEHNIAKHKAIKKAFYMTAMDQTDGNYYEFGVFTGSSFVCALRAKEKMKDISDLKTDFYGFDSFSGFGDVSSHDKHRFFQNHIFSVPNKKKVERFIDRRKKKNKVQLIEGYFDKTIKNKSCKSKGLVRIAFIDCDLKDPAALALEYLREGLQEGSILIMDDFYFFKGSEERGIAGAFFEFERKYPKIRFRKLIDYGYGSAAFIVSKIQR